MVATATGQLHPDNPHRPVESKVRHNPVPGLTIDSARNAVLSSHSKPSRPGLNQELMRRDVLRAASKRNRRVIQGTRAVSTTKRSIDEVEEPHKQRTPTPRYVPIVARAPQPSPVPSIPPITLSPEPEGSSGNRLLSPRRTAR
ncbi:hypothetical protein E4U22_003894 [Claviceps purpurea]|nr:hypothetical protein E4U22_003894 [Claviceps purpurea]